MIYLSFPLWNSQLATKLSYSTKHKVRNFHSLQCNTSGILPVQCSNADIGIFSVYCFMVFLLEARELIPHHHTLDCALKSNKMTSNSNSSGISTQSWKTWPPKEKQYLVWFLQYIPNLHLPTSDRHPFDIPIHEWEL